MKPMLAAQCDDIDVLRFPLYGTPKIDGIRCLILGGEAVSRALKPIPNAYICLSLRGLPPFDGELQVGESFQACSSGIMSEGGEPDFCYHVFDLVGDGGYLQRMQKMSHAADRLSMEHVGRLKFLYPVRLENRTALDAYLGQCLKLGHEGVMIRSADGPYKYGRATFREGYLIKIKPFEDDEAEIVGFEEQMHNGNEATTNALGHAARSSRQANLIPNGTLGALVVEHPKFGTFNIGTGLDNALRAEIWNNRSAYLGVKVKFKYQKAGTKNRPRIPVFIGIRNILDT